MAKILLVEDDNNLREIYEARLQAEGYTIVSANDGEAALVIAKGEKPDLIISDVMMPKISGFEMLDIMRNTDGLKDVKVIMLTALGQADDQARANKLGADRYLVKSQVTLEDIVKVSHELLEDQPAPEAAAPSAPSDTTAPAPTPEAPAIPDTPAPTITVSAPPADPVSPPPSTAPVPDVPVAAAPEPVAPADPPTASSGSTPPDTTAQSSAAEEATVEQQIENFVNDQPATPPAAVEPTPATADAAETAANTANDASLSEAVDNLVADTEATEAETAVPTEVSSTMVEPAAEPVTVPVKTAEPETTNDSVPVAHKKVIQPLDATPQKSLDELLAKEEAQQPLPAPQPILGDASVESSDLPSGAPAPPPHQAGTVIDPDGTTHVDPNSIAL